MNCVFVHGWSVHTIASSHIHWRLRFIALLLHEYFSRTFSVAQRRRASAGAGRAGLVSVGTQANDNKQTKSKNVNEQKTHRIHVE